MEQELEAWGFQCPDPPPKSRERGWRRSCGQAKQHSTATGGWQPESFSYSTRHREVYGRWGGVLLARAWAAPSPSALLGVHLCPLSPFL